MNAPTLPLQNHDADEGDREEAFVQSIIRGLSVIKAFGLGRERLTMAELAHACGITRARTRRILLTFEDLGYVRRDGRHFTLTACLLHLSRGYAPRSIWDAAHAHLQRVSNSFNEAVSAGVLEGGDVLYVVRIQSSRTMRVDLRPGSRLPAHLSAMGRVLLAALPPEELDDRLRRASFPRLTSHTLADRDAVRAEIDRVRERGWCCARAEIDEALWCVAVPLRDQSDRVIAAIHMSLSAQRASDELVENQVVPALLAAAAEIRTSL